MANSDMCLEAARKAFPDNEELRVAYMLGFNEGYDKATEQPSLPSNLDEAAGEYSERFQDGKDKLYAFHGFRDGALWRDSQIQRLSNGIDGAAELSANDAMIKRQFPSVVYNTGLKCFDHSDLIKQFKAGAEWMNKQMKVPNSTKLISEWHNVKTILEEKDFRGDEWRLAYNAFMFGFSRGINTQKTEK